MALPTIFCPQCDELILEAKRCPTCDWQRPPTTGRVGQSVWAVALETKLPRQGVRPVAIGGVAYFPTDTGQIVAVDIQINDPESAVKWRYRLDQHYQCHGLANWEDTLLPGLEYTGGFPKPPGELLMLSAETGDEVWRYSIEGASLSVPAVHNGIAFFTDNIGWLYAIDLPTREELWRQKIDSGWAWAPAAPLLTPTGLLILPGRSEQIVAIDVEKRTVAWTFSGGEWFPQTPAWRDGVVYIRCWDRHIYALDETNGQEKWRYTAPRDFNSDLWVNDSYIYVGVKDYRDGAESGSRAYALYTLDRRTGERVSRYEVSGHIVARPIATESAVFVATDDRSRKIKSQGTLYVLDAQGQQLLWDQPYVVKQRFTCDLLPVGDLIIAGTRQGAIYAIRWQDVAEVEAPQVYLEREEWQNAAIAYAYRGAYTQAAEIYAERLDQPLPAGKLLLRAGEPRRVLDLLGQSENEMERALAIKAAQALPKVGERAEALSDLGEYLAAAGAYAEVEAWLKAGACYEQAQAWEEARAVYFRASAVEAWEQVAWERWEDVTRKLGLWEDLIKRLLKAGQPAKAAEVYEEIGRFGKAAEYYVEAGLPAEALAAYRQVKPEKLTPEARTRMAKLAEQAGEVEVAIEAYQAVSKASDAANLAEDSGYYEQALALFREAGRELKAAEMLEKLERYAEAGEIFAQKMFWGRAAENFERQVERIIEDAGQLRLVRGNQQVEAWLERAARFFDDEGEEKEEKSEREYYYRRARQVRRKLARIKREPILSVSFQTDELVSNQSSVVQYMVKNVGWGSARDVRLTITSPDIQRQIEPMLLGSLRRDMMVTNRFVVVPNIAGAVMLHVTLDGRSRSGESLTLPVEGGNNILLEARTGVEVQPASGGERLGGIWDEDSSSSSGDSDSRAVSVAELKQEQIESLKRQQVQYQSNLNKLLEQAAAYGGVSQAPLPVQNQIEAQQQAIAEIEEKLAELWDEDEA